MTALLRGALAMLLLVFAGNACAVDDKPLAMEVLGQVVIARDGSVRDATIDFPVPAAISTLVLKSVRQWKFAPIVRNGASIEARTGYSLKLTATPVAQGYAIHVDEVSFINPRKPAEMAPFTAGREVNQAFAALIAIRVDASGAVFDAQVLALQSLKAGKELRDPRKLTEAMMRFAKGVHFQPARIDLGDPPGLDRRITVSFNNPDKLSSWRTPEFKDVERAPWESEATPGEALAPSDASRIAAEPDVKLQSAVVGTTL